MESWPKLFVVEGGKSGDGKASPCPPSDIGEHAGTEYLLHLLELRELLGRMGVEHVTSIDFQIIQFYAYILDYSGWE